MSRVVTARKPIRRLLDNSVIEAWVNEGRVIHEAKDCCQFCGQPLPADLMTHLAGHFSADYDDLMAEVSALSRLLDSAASEKLELDHKGDFYPELSIQFEAQKTKLESLFEARKSELKKLAKAVAAKSTNAFTKLECPAVEDPVEQIVAIVHSINALIAEHNRRTTEFDMSRKEAFNKLEGHYAATFIRDQKYNQKMAIARELETSIAEQGKLIHELENEIRNLKSELSEASIGADRINKLLGAYFGKNDLNIVVMPDGRFQIIRGDMVARNLSEGEKTAIAFAYFIISVEDGSHPIADTRIVIDDPISSLDANHLFNTYSLIRTHLEDCGQLFILTHSFELFSLVREWAAEDEGSNFTNIPQPNWKKWGLFLVKRNDNGHATFEAIPKELLRFKSEYHYLFSMMYNFDRSEADDFSSLLSLPNVIRRFLEAFGGIMIPLSIGLKKKLDRIFVDESVRCRVWKFVNHYSHQNTIARSLTIPDTSECRAVVRACLDAVQEWDGEYFRDLESEVA